MKQVQVIKYLISHEHAARMMKKLSAKRHAKQGFFFELEDLGTVRQYLKAIGQPSFEFDIREGIRGPHNARLFSGYKPNTEIAQLTVYRDVTVPELCVQVRCQSLPASQVAEIHDARRELRKWLNEQPNREVDKAAIATLIIALDILIG